MPAARRALLLAAPALLPGLLVARGAAAARVLRHAPETPTRDPATAAGALVWLHAHYTEGPPPSLPDFAVPLLDAGWDLWRMDREGPPLPLGGPPSDPLAEGAERLAAATARLRLGGYRRIAVLGESRGAFIALSALYVPNLAGSLLLLAPAAHGTRPERRPAALADFRAALAATAPGALGRAGLVLFAEDPYDPDPEARGAAFRQAMAAQRIPSLLIDRPAAPTGHGGARNPEFAARFGACLCGFLDSGAALPAECAPYLSPGATP